MKKLHPTNGTNVSNNNRTKQFEPKHNKRTNGNFFADVWAMGQRIWFLLLKLPRRIMVTKKMPPAPSLRSRIVLVEEDDRNGGCRQTLFSFIYIPWRGYFLNFILFPVYSRESRVTSPEPVSSSEENKCAPKNDYDWRDPVSARVCIVVCILVYSEKWRWWRGFS